MLGFAAMDQKCSGNRDLIQEYPPNLKQDLESSENKYSMEERNESYGQYWSNHLESRGETLHETYYAL